MNKRIKLTIIAMISLPLLYVIISFSSSLIENYIETNTYHILIYNYTNDEIVININDKYTINVEDRTSFWDRVFFDKVFNKDNKYNNFLIKSNGNIIFNEEMDVIGSFSAKGGLFTNIVINTINEMDYDVVFTTAFDNESKIGNWLELKSIKKKKICRYF